MYVGEANAAQLSELDPGERAAAWLQAKGVRRVWCWDVPLTVVFRGIRHRDGLILEGAAGSDGLPLLGEAAPFWNYPPRVAARWFDGAIALATRGFPGLTKQADSAAPEAGGISEVPLNVTVPVVEAREAARLVTESGCRTAKVKVIDPRCSWEDDLERLRAVRDALGAAGNIRVDLNAAWSLKQARELLPRLDEAAGGLEYAEQPCAELADLAELQYATGIPLAADESIRLAENPAESLLQVAQAGLAAVIVKVMPLGGPSKVSKLLQGYSGKVVVSSALDSGVGLSAGAALANRLAITAACGLRTGRLLRGGILMQEPEIRQDALVTPSELQLNLSLPAVSAELSARWRARLEEIAGERT